MDYSIPWNKTQSIHHKNNFLAEELLGFMSERGIDCRIVSLADFIWFNGGDADDIPTRKVAEKAIWGELDDTVNDINPETDKPYKKNSLSVDMNIQDNFQYYFLRRALSDGVDDPLLLVGMCMSFLYNKNSVWWAVHNDLYSNTRVQYIKNGRINGGKARYRRS